MYRRKRKKIQVNFRDSAVISHVSDSIVSVLALMRQVEPVVPIAPHGREIYSENRYISAGITKLRI